jgi:hypothetical protein
MKDLLDEVVASATRALEHARKLREQGADAVAAEIARLDDVARGVAACTTEKPRTEPRDV